MADYDSSANYKQARAMGRHYLSEHSDSATKGYLYILDDLLDNVEICGEINLGTTEIPLGKILGHPHLRPEQRLRRELYAPAAREHRVRRKVVQAL